MFNVFVTSFATCSCTWINHQGYIPRDCSNSDALFDDCKTCTITVFCPTVANSRSDAVSGNTNLLYCRPSASTRPLAEEKPEISNGSVLQYNFYTENGKIYEEKLPTEIIK